MALMPKRVKFRKSQRGRRLGTSFRGASLAFGEFGLKALEKECLANNAKFTSWECDRKKMNLTKGGKALYMHCLPADITDVSCKAGEVSAEVFEQYRIATYQEAAYKPFIISALMFLERIQDPKAKLAAIVERARSLSL